MEWYVVARAGVPMNEQKPMELIDAGMMGLYLLAFGYWSIRDSRNAHPMRA